MLYKIANGCVSEEHYGLALSRVVDLPPMVRDIASNVSETLERQLERRKRSSATVALSKRRRLVLGLRQQLLHVRDGQMEGRALIDWLRILQREFVSRMSEIDADARDSREYEDGDDEELDKMDVDDEDSESERSESIDLTDGTGTIVGDNHNGGRLKSRSAERQSSPKATHVLGQMSHGLEAEEAEPSDFVHESSSSSAFSELLALDRA
ncbi:MAG: peroxisome biogenesis factor 10 [Chaenotheca gracillima]|nr:MAG: peroxisome biogenesis factor 10 [Chaenotheca gracillima]